jgi:hypothetical protein
MRLIKAGSTDQSTVIRFVDSTTGDPETGVAYNTSGMALWYRREGGLKVAITPATLAAANSAHSDGGMIHVSDGYCRVDLPDAAVASGATGVTIGGSATGMVAIAAYHELDTYRLSDLPAAVWAVLTSTLTTTGSVGKYILDKLAVLISGTTTLSTTGLIVDGEVLEVFKGESKSYTLAMPASTWGDLTGFTGKLGIKRLSGSTGTETLEVTASVADANTEGQQFVFSWTTVQTAAFLESPGGTHPFRTSPASYYAYRFTAGATNGAGVCHTAAQGYVHVRPRDITCTV